MRDLATVSEGLSIKLEVSARDMLAVLSDLLAELEEIGVGVAPVAEKVSGPDCVAVGANVSDEETEFPDLVGATLRVFVMEHSVNWSVL